MPSLDSQSFLRELDENGAERHGRPSNVARRVCAGARINRKGVLDRRYTQLQIDPANLSSLIDLIGSALKY